MRFDVGTNYLDMKKNLRQIPDFQNEDEEREFWSHNDSTDFIDWANTESIILENLKPTDFSEKEGMTQSE